MAGIGTLNRVVAGHLLGSDQLDRLRQRALAGALLSAGAAGSPQAGLPVQVEAREVDSSMCLAVVAADGEVLALYKVGRLGGRPSLTQVPCPEAPVTVFARSRALRAASSESITQAVALRSRGLGLSGRSGAVRSRSAGLLSRSRDLRGGAFGQISRSWAIRAASCELIARARASRMRSAAQVEQALCLCEKASSLRGPFSCSAAAS